MILLNFSPFLLVKVELKAMNSYRLENGMLRLQNPVSAGAANMTETC